MKSFRKVLLAGAVVLIPVAALAAGILTNGVPQIVPGGTYYASNGVITPVTNASPSTGFSYSNEIGGYELAPVDTQIGGGSSPQSLAPSAFQIAAIALGVASNTGTTSSGAVTLSHTLGTLTSEALTTAAGASYTITLTNTTVALTSHVQVAAYLGTSTQGALQIVSVTPAAGSVVIVVKNIGSLALNGTIIVPFQVQ
jgi:hypothetical protein